MNLSKIDSFPSALVAAEDPASVDITAMMDGVDSEPSEAEGAGSAEGSSLMSFLSGKND